MVFSDSSEMKEHDDTKIDKISRIKCFASTSDDLRKFDQSKSDASRFDRHEDAQNFSLIQHVQGFRPPEKVKKEDFNRHQLFSTNKQYVKIKLMQNETNLWSICLVKTK